MNPLGSEHAGILYPSNLPELGIITVSTRLDADLVPLPLLQGLPAAIIVPHAAYQYALPYLRQAFSSTTVLRPERIVALAPLHRPRIEKDADPRIFCPESNFWDTPGGTVTVDAKSSSVLETTFPTVFARENPYFQEEYGLELILPFCLRRFPKVAVLPMLADIHDEYGQQAALEALAVLYGDNHSTLFIISSNFNQPPSLQSTDATTIELALREGNQTYLCGGGWIHAMNRISKSKLWNLGLAATSQGSIPIGRTRYFSASKEWT
jgi:MEMO1 family protein